MEEGKSFLLSYEEQIEVVGVDDLWGTRRPRHILVGKILCHKTENQMLSITKYVNPLLNRRIGIEINSCAKNRSTKTTIMVAAGRSAK